MVLQGTTVMVLQRRPRSLSNAHMQHAVHCVYCRRPAEHDVSNAEYDDLAAVYDASFHRPQKPLYAGEPRQ